MNNTQDLSKFGYRELDIAADLLKAYATSPPEFLTDGVTIEFNVNSGEVFLVDEDYNVAMLSDGKLAEWYTCAYCGKEGFAEDIEDDGKHSFDDHGDINCPEEKE